MKYDIAIVGGGRVGLPLGLLFADKGLNVLIYDINEKSINDLKDGKLPFLENDCDNLIKKTIREKNINFTNKSNNIKNSKYIIITIGTNIDEWQNPGINGIINCIDSLPINNDHIIILRSTVFPGVSEYVSRHLKEKGLMPLLAFCPERLLQGEAIKELQTLPQIVSGTTDMAVKEATKLFNVIAPSIVHMEVMEAEFGKLFANCYRYIQFSCANEFYKMATNAGLNYNNILNGIKKNYPRLNDLPRAGFAGGGCLIKDSLNLCAYSNGDFALGYAAVQSNENLPSFIVSQLEKKYDLTTKTVGLLGMAFKKDNDDIRSSLSYKLKKILKFKSKEVLTTDPLVPLNIDPSLLPAEEVINRSDILILCIPHTSYENLYFKGKEVVNIWNG